MKLFRQKSKFQIFVILNNDSTEVYLGNNNIAIPEQLTALPHLRKCLKSLPVLDSTHYINVAVLSPRNTNADHISEQVLNSLDREVKILSVFMTNTNYTSPKYYQHLQNYNQCS